ncbi:MAG: MATE family efflux transporter [Deltaproteobacteria bacterium]|nr:MATE family efflux transporter [Deltaproteobacteria bacterium]MBN2846684.1 MATE family efflux transporter [Deltaproteobacteria bacterium]
MRAREMNRYRDLTTEPVPALIRRIAIPASVGYFFNTMFNVVDTFFGGLISTQVVAALSLSLPVFFIIIAMGVGVSTGTTALIANALGAGNRTEARLIAIQGITFGVLTAIAITLIGCLTAPVLFTLLGASDAYLSDSLIYMDTIFIGTVFFMLSYMFNAILTALGDTKSFRNFLIIGFFMNIILDPWFIYGGLGVPRLGITGIALATVLVQIVGCLYLGFRVYKTRLIAGKDVKEIFPKARPFRDIARQGFPASISMMSVALGIFVITFFVSKFGKEAVAAYGIATRVEQIILLPTIGLNVATLTIVAQNNGAGFFDRIRETLNRALTYGGVLMVFGTIAVFAGAVPLMDVFTDDGSVIEIGKVFLRIDSLVFFAYVILFVNVAALQGVKRPMYAIWLGLARQVAAPVIVFYLLVGVAGWGLLGIWWGIFFITWAAALVTLFYSRSILKKAEGESRGSDAGFERHEQA